MHERDHSLEDSQQPTQVTDRVSKQDDILHEYKEKSEKEVSDPAILSNSSPQDSLEALSTLKTPIHAKAEASESVRLAIPHRPRVLPSAFANTLRKVNDWTGQMRAVYHAHQRSAPSAQRGGEENPNLTLPKAGREAIADENTLALPLVLPTPPSVSQLTPDAKTALMLQPQPRRVGSRRRSRAMRVAWLMRQRRERKNSHVKKGKRLGTIFGSVLASLVVILISSALGSSYVYYQRQLPQVQNLANLQTPQSTRIYDRNGNLLSTLYNDKYGRGTPISYDEIPGFMQDAQIATEDKTFWTNGGVDPQAILRSAFTNASSEQVQTGASTITQQVVKNLDHNQQRSLQRKLSEATLAIGLTQQYPKWKILEMYFNIVPYGTQELGIEAAAQDFFGLKPVCDAHFKCIPAISFLDRDLSKCKNPKDETSCAIDPILGLARASLMAGIPQNPPDYDPLTNPDNYPLLLQRQNYVLTQMMADGMSINLGLGSLIQNVEPITPDVVNKVEALSKNIQFVGFNGGHTALHFVRWVIQTLALSLGNGDYSAGLIALDNSGLNVRTTLDLNLETYVEHAINRHVNQPEYQEYLGYTETLSKDDNLHDSAVVVMDAKTGEVLAMDGSANWKDTTAVGSGQIDMALTPRQPGSSFKPIAVAAAYQMGLYPGIVLPDYKTYFPTGQSQNQPVNTTNTYAPPDYGGTWHNIRSNIETAISNSFNVPALKTEYYAGLQNVYNMAVRLGITAIDPKTGLVPSMVLGTDAVPLLQMVDAYQTFANQGMHAQPQNVLDIWDNYGRRIYHYDPNHPDTTRVLSPEVAYLVTSTLDNEQARAIEFPGDTLLPLDDWTLPNGNHPQVAAKTGTTDSFKDNWTIGYTPDVVVGVWSGNADDSPMVNSIGITGAAPIWHSVIEYASGHCNQVIDQIPCPAYDLGQVVGSNYTFSIPSDIVQQEVNTYNGLAGSGYNSYMINGEQPQQR